MTETPESRAEPTTVTGKPRAVEPPRRRYDDDQYDRPSRLSQVLAWVGIVAGVVFVVAVIFFSGFLIGRTSGHHYGGHHHGYYGCQMGPGTMNPSGTMNPGMMGPARWGPARWGPASVRTVRAVRTARWGPVSSSHQQQQQRPLPPRLGHLRDREEPTLIHPIFAVCTVRRVTITTQRRARLARRC